MMTHKKRKAKIVAEHKPRRLALTCRALLLVLAACLVVGLDAPSDAQAVIIGGWYNRGGSGPDAPEESLPGFTLTLDPFNEVGGVGGRSSGDGTYGTLAGSAPSYGPSDNSGENIWVNTNGSALTLDVFIQNNTGEDVILDSFHFDGQANNAHTWNLSVLAGSDIDVGLVTSGSLANIGGVPFGTSPDFEDFDVSLAGLTDRTLADGESATFQLVATGNTDDVHFDNIALTQFVPAVPEPSSFLLLGLGALGVLRSTRRRCLKA